MTTPRKLICFNCRHFTPTTGGCRAFPMGIPDQIFQTNRHDKPLPGQVNNIVFEPIEKQKSTG